MLAISSPAMLLQTHKLNKKANKPVQQKNIQIVEVDGDFCIMLDILPKPKRVLIENGLSVNPQSESFPIKRCSAKSEKFPMKRRAAQYCSAIASSQRSPLFPTSL